MYGLIGTEMDGERAGLTSGAGKAREVPEKTAEAEGGSQRE